MKVLHAVSEGLFYLEQYHGVQKNGQSLHTKHAGFSAFTHESIMPITLIISGGDLAPPGDC